MVKSKNKEPEIDPNEGPLEVISTKEALGRLDDLVLFFEYSSIFLLIQMKFYSIICYSFMLIS
jgi:hypothetical protein